ncbi:hypothetical protein ACFWFG_38430, partial [Streptomyces roseolus]
MPRTRSGPLTARLVQLVLAAVAVILFCGNGIAAAQPSTPPTVPAPTVPAPATPSTAPAPAPTRPADPGSLPPTTSGVPVPGQRPASPGGSTGTGNECGVTNIEGCVTGAIDGFFQRVVDSALNPLMGFLTERFLTTPDPEALPQIEGLWKSSWQLMVALYGLVVIAVGVLLMFHETLQTRWGWRELLPRLVGGFLAGALSMTLATQAILLANALARALAGDDVSRDSAVSAFKSMMQVGGGT